MKEIEHNTEAIRTLYSTDEFETFFDSLDEKTRIKFKQAFDIAQTIYVLNAKFVKRLVDTDLYEMRVSVGLNGFLKKSTKDYEKQIKKAERIIKDLEL